MNNINNKDIITALATPYGRSAIAVIRVSGEKCKALVEKFLSRPLEKDKLKLNVFDGGNFTERLMAVYYKAPNSYTGEDTVELFPHGNMTICDGIIKVLTDNGARLAERGEFTSRAFFNGKLDLTQCEALADIIDAETTEQLVYGNKRFDGEFVGLKKAEEILNRALSSIEAVLHYGDELEDNEIDNAVCDDVFGKIDVLIDVLETEKQRFGGGRIVNDGFKVALVGMPNAGKSTLLNALTESDRAIVTDIAGTTRDTVEGTYVYKQKKFVIIDTAGITETRDEVEKIGIERAKSAAKDADAVIFLSETVKMNNSDVSGIKVYVENKCDDIADVGEEYRKAEKNGKLKISAKHGKNITALKQKLYDICPKEVGAICNHRQYDCILRCLDALKSAKDQSVGVQNLEIVAAALYEAYSAIEQLYGKSADERVLDSVFERFCVGK